MKSRSIITKLSTIVNKDNLFWIVVLILTATLFYMLGWINCKTIREPIKIENPEEASYQYFKTVKI